jgi:1-acyl-sn-glycerol-3-phosphate acyltransferase
VIKLGGKLVYNLIKAIILLGAWPLFKFKVIGAGRVPRRGGLLIASNHVSHLDPPLVGVAIPRYVFHMAKLELFKVGWLLALMRTLGTIMVDRSSGQPALEEAIRYITHGASVVIFPEGTRSQDGRLQKGRSGAIVIAVQAGCPILPVAIVGSQHGLTKGSKKIKPVPVEVRIGEQYRIDYDGDPQNIPHDFLRQETYKLMERIEALLPEDMRPRPEEKETWYKRELASLTQSAQR